MDQGHALLAAQGHRQPDRGQLLKLAEVVPPQGHVPRVPALRRAALHLPAPRDEAPERLDAWLAWASRSRLKPFVKLARTIRKHKPGVLAARLDLSNGRLEALNSKVRLITHRAYGFHSADALIAMIYLCCAGIPITLPHRESPPLVRRAEKGRSWCASPLRAGSCLCSTRPSSSRGVTPDQRSGAAWRSPTHKRRACFSVAQCATLSSA